MTQISSIKEMIALWPSRRALADDCGPDCTLDRVNKWAQSGSIPAAFHARIIRAADRRQLPVTTADLVRLHDVDAPQNGEAA